MVRNKLGIAKTYHIQPSEIDRMQFWEYEYYIDEITNDIEAERERQEEESAKYDASSFKMPDYKMPEFKMPDMPSY